MKCTIDTLTKKVEQNGHDYKLRREIFSLKLSPNT